ncbi:F-box/kelch-repeat protein At3g06240-like [Rutidosis leptorrhynchoides]|uniref:F-box/kelch-repeat protein At3g06240-like n=1 Tax=Rutidosis leptorrhynchoides TaxID=125765 RepID=UPI003A99A792
MKRLDVKSLLRFRSVSKAWKSLIDSPNFVAIYGIDHIRMHRILVPYLKAPTSAYMSFVDHDDTFLFDQTNVHVLPREHNMCSVRILGSSHGLFCLECTYINRNNTEGMYLIWNPSIRKSVRIVFPTNSFSRVYFGVCPFTLDPKLVKITIGSLKWLVEIYTLSSGSWRKIYNNLPRGTIEICWYTAIVVTNRIIYWDATDSAVAASRYIVSFDLTSEEFKLTEIPNFIAHHKYDISKLKHSLVFLKYSETEKVVCEVWMMMNNGVSKTFTKLYNIAPSNLLPHGVMGFTKRGTPIIKMRHDCEPDGLYVFEPTSERVTKIDLDRAGNYFKFYNYYETLLLHDC